MTQAIIEKIEAQQKKIDEYQRQFEKAKAEGRHEEARNYLHLQANESLNMQIFDDILTSLKLQKQGVTS